MIATCVDATVLESLGEVIAGSFLATTSDGDSADAGTYAAMIEKYAPDEDIDPDPIVSAGVGAGVGAVLNVVRAMEGLTGDVTAETVLAQMKAAADVRLEEHTSELQSLMRLSLAV